MISPAHVGLRAFLAKTGYKNPTDPHHGAFQTGHGTQLHFFEKLEQDPKKAVEFNNHMAGYSLSRARWVDPGCFPVRDVLGKPGPDTGVLLVDVGGGSGHDLALFKKQHAELPGRVILQDLPSVIESCRSSLPAGIEAMAHDFFTPQPVKGIKKIPVPCLTQLQPLTCFIPGACSYCLHAILHDWPDEKCREILRNLVPAMTRGRSKILLNENVIANTDVHWETSGLDLVMMSCFSAKERTESEWHELMRSVGLRIVKTWNYEKGAESLTEAELA